MRKIVSIVCVAILMVVCISVGYHLGCAAIDEQIYRDTIIDTITETKPIYIDSIIVQERVRKLPVYYDVHDTITDTLLRIDSVNVAIPITQKRYDSENYKAWVSGYEPSLDSIDVYRKTETITIRERQRRWGIGVVGGVGYGITSRKVEPFVGVGVTYRLY